MAVQWCVDGTLLGALAIEDYNVRIAVGRAATACAEDAEGCAADVAAGSRLPPCK